MSEDQKQTKSRVDHLAKEIGQRLFNARDGLGMSQESLHNRTKIDDPEGLGISRSVLSLYERGINKPGAREISILCLALHISPNWLLFGSESPAQVLQPSLVFLQGDELTVSIRLAFGMLALSATERDSLTSLLFSLLTKTLGDSRLSSLMYMASEMSPELKKIILDQVGADAEKLPITELLDKFVEKSAESYYTNFGNLRPLISDEDLDDFDPDHPPPPRKL